MTDDEKHIRSALRTKKNLQDMPTYRIISAIINKIFYEKENHNEIYLQAIPKLVEGLTVDQVVEKIGGISCNGRPTSCGDQLARACREALEASKQQ